MIILVDGIDRTGKTTLVERLSMEFNYPVFKDDTRYSLSYGNMVLNSEKLNTLINVIEKGLVKDAIFDRFHWTEFIYGKVDRGYVNHDVYDMERRLENYSIKTGNVVQVIMYPDDIDWSNKEHGSELNEHMFLFDFVANMTNVYTMRATYNLIDDCIRNIGQIIKHGGTR